MAETITLELPDQLHQRLLSTAQATQQTLEAVILRALTVGSPPDWTDVPEEYQSDLAALDRLDDKALLKIAHASKSSEDMARYDELLDDACPSVNYWSDKSLAVATCGFLGSRTSDFFFFFDLRGCFRNRFRLTCLASALSC